MESKDKSIFDFFFNLGSRDENTFANFLYYTFNVFLLLQVIALLMYVDSIAYAFSNGASVFITMVFIVFYGSTMWLSKIKLDVANNEIAISHLKILKMISSFSFYFFVGQMVFSFLTERYEVLDKIVTAIAFVADVVIAFACYTALRRLRVGQAYGFDNGD